MHACSCASAGASLRSCSTRKEGQNEAVARRQVQLIELLLHKANANPFAENYYGALPLLNPLPRQVPAAFLRFQYSVDGIQCELATASFAVSTFG